MISTINFYPGSQCDCFGGLRRGRYRKQPLPLESSVSAGHGQVHGDVAHRAERSYIGGAARRCGCKEEERALVEVGVDF